MQYKAGRKAACFILLATLLSNTSSAQTLDAAPPPSSNEDIGGWVVHSQKLKSGVPLGGIGCGTFELMTDGSTAYATINNNWSRPTGELKGCFAAVWTRAQNRVEAQVLETHNPYGLPGVSKLNYRGNFPVADIRYSNSDLPVVLRLRAFSPLIPHDLKNSSLPVAIYSFRVKNIARGPVEAAIAVSWQNILGIGGNSVNSGFNDQDGDTVQRLVPTPGYDGVMMGGKVPSNLTGSAKMQLNAAGDYALMVKASRPDEKTSTASWNVLEKTPTFWSTFAKEGDVSGECGPAGDGVKPAGVVAIRVLLKPDEERRFVFAFAWYTPHLLTLSGEDYGHYYELSFDSAASIARYALSNELTLETLTREWQYRLQTSSLPGWYTSMLINGAASLFTNTILTQRRQFTVVVSPGDKERELGGMDRWMAGHALIFTFFPDLEEQEIQQFSTMQTDAGALPRFDGSINSSIGAVARSSRPERLENPDIGCEFAAIIYQYYLETGDRSFLDAYYPHAKHAIQYLFSQDSDHDGIPEGGSTFADLHHSGSFCYTATMWLAALRAGEAMAKAMDDTEFANQCRSWYAKSSDSVMRELWNGRYLDEWYDSAHPVNGKPIRSTACFAYQLAGEWVADELGLDPLLDPKVVQSCTSAITALNDHASSILPPAEVQSNGGLGSNHQCWLPFAETYQAALYAYEGNPGASLALLQRINRDLTQVSQDPWGISLVYDGVTGLPIRDRWTMAAPAIWYTLGAFAGYRLDRPDQTLKLRPSIPPSWPLLRVPWFGPTFWASFDYMPGLRRTRMSLYIDHTFVTQTYGSNLRFTNNEPVGMTIRRINLSISPELERLPVNDLRVDVSLGKAPISGKLIKENGGRYLFIADGPFTMHTGDRLSIVVIRKESSIQ
ncbi:MAG: GH116 family glycosyl-hydrolase [Armatimonadetes bacterium]|nr:GH116 family glycosyl-hydrolase [Armatimonadota bacterium]